MKLLLLVCFLPLTTVLGQSTFRIDSLPANGVVLDKNWKWHLGDNPDWAKPEFDDSAWDTLNPAQSVMQLHRLPAEGVGWLRINLRIAPVWRGKLIGLSIYQAGATELFLNRKLVLQNGKITPQKIIDVGSIFPAPTFMTFNDDSIQVIAVRYAFTRVRLFRNNNVYSFFRLNLMRSELAEKSKIKLNINNSVEFFLFGIFLVLGLLQLLLYTTSSEQQTTLSLGLFLITQSIVHLLNGASTDSISEVIGFTRNLVIYDISYAIFNVAIAISSFYYLLGIYQYFNYPRRTTFWVVAVLTLATIPAAFLLEHPYSALAPFILGVIIPFSAILRVGVLAIKQKRSGAKVFTFAHSVTLIVFIGWTISQSLPLVFSFLATNGLYLFSMSFLGLGLTISLLLSQERVGINKLLQKQLLDLEILSQRNLAQEQEKQQLLATQNERLEQQVETRTAELKASQAQLVQKEKLASLGELTAGIAHEIQNPLNFVNNFSEVSTELISELKDELDKGDAAEARTIADDLSRNLQKIHHHGSRASSIVKGMLEHSRTDSGEKRSTDLNALTEEYFKIAYHGLRAKDKSFNCELVTDFDPTLGQVTVAPQELGRVLLNLYNNAFYAVSQRAKQSGTTDYQPRVEVSTQRQAGQVEIRVKDNGTGIPESVKAKIFQPFFTTKPTGEGTGLGLSLSYDIIIKGHGGAMTVESQLQQGTVFTISLPLSMPN